MLFHRKLCLIEIFFFFNMSTSIFHFKWVLPFPVKIHLFKIFTRATPGSSLVTNNRGKVYYFSYPQIYCACPYGRCARLAHLCRLSTFSGGIPQPRSRQTKHRIWQSSNSRTLSHPHATPQTPHEPHWTWPKKHLQWKIGNIDKQKLIKDSYQSGLKNVFVSASTIALESSVVGLGFSTLGDL